MNNKEKKNQFLKDMTTGWLLGWLSAYMCMCKSVRACDVKNLNSVVIHILDNIIVCFLFCFVVAAAATSTTTAAAATAAAATANKTFIVVDINDQNPCRCFHHHHHYYFHQHHLQCCCETVVLPSNSFIHNPSFYLQLQLTKRV